MTSLPAMKVEEVVPTASLSPAPFLARMEMVKTLFSSSPVRVWLLEDPLTVTIELPSTPGHPVTVKEYVMR